MLTTGGVYYLAALDLIGRRCSADNDTFLREERGQVNGGYRGCNFHYLFGMTLIDIFLGFLASPPVFVSAPESPIGKRR